MTATAKEWDQWHLQQQMAGTLYTDENPYGPTDPVPVEWDFGGSGGLEDASEAAEWSFDEVEKPRHYNSGKIEAIEAIKASMSREEYLGYLKGNALKYLWRYQYKGKPLQDLEKAQWYLNRLKEEHK